MASTIKLKNGSGAPTTGDLVQGEPALDLTNKRLYTENASGVVIEVGTNPSTIDINAGTIDGTVIGGSTAAAVTGTTITGTSFVSSGDMTFGDNDKAIFGAGSDLQIYHDGSNSYVKDAGTGGLFIQGSTFVAIQDANGVSAIIATDNGAVNLRYNGGGKLATTNTGIDVTGTVTADGLTVDGTFNFTSAVNGIINTPASCFINIDSDNNNAGESFYISRDATNTAGARVAKFDAIGDVSFYEDTGTTAKFFWDASDETISIGTGASSTATISAYSRTVSASLPSALRIIENTGASSYWDIGSTGGASNNLNFYANANTTPKMTLTGAGNVGIGTSSPQASLTVAGGLPAASSPATYAGTIQINETALSTLQEVGGLEFRGAVFGSGYGSKITSTDTGSLLFGRRSNNVSWSESMRIDSSGKVGIGLSPATQLDVQAGTTASSSFGLRVAAGTNTSDYCARFNNAAGTFLAGIDGSGNVGIGTSSPTTFSGYVTVHHKNTSGDAIHLIESDGGIIGQTVINDASGVVTMGARSNHPWRVTTNDTERLRIDSLGNLLVGTTSAVTGSVAGGFQLQNNSGTGSTINIGHPSGAASGFSYALFSYDNSIIGSIGQSGTTAVLYNTSSDQRLKENITDANDAGDKIDAIKVRQYDWKAGGSHQDYGMVAQELMTVAPEAVSVPEDPEKMMGVDYSKLVPMMLKEIQSLRARVAQLEGAN